jgi:uncharacterized protein
VQHPAKVSRLKLHQHQAAGRNAFTGYGDGYVLVNGARHESGILVLPDAAVVAWDVADIAHLDEQRIALLAALDAEVLLIGTGRRLLFPAPRLLLPLAQAGMGVEIMDTPAACRTYNILMGEGRRVAAALIVAPPETPARDAVRPAGR